MRDAGELRAMCDILERDAQSGSECDARCKGAERAWRRAMRPNAAGTPSIYDAERGQMMWTMTED